MVVGNVEFSSCRTLLLEAKKENVSPDDSLYARSQCQDGTTFGSSEGGQSHIQNDLSRRSVAKGS